MSTNRRRTLADDMDEEGGGEHLRYRPLADLLNEPADGSRYSSISYVVGRGGAAPASEEAIEALKDVDDQPPAAECAICLHHQGDAAGAAGWKEMPCEHRFHGGCLVRWLRVHGTCPMCRHRMPTVDEEEEVEMEEVVEPVESGEADGGTMEVRSVLVRSSVRAAAVAAPLHGMDRTGT